MEEQVLKIVEELKKLSRETNDEENRFLLRLAVHCLERLLERLKS